jgi:hypothetical protein
MKLRRVNVRRQKLKQQAEARRKAKLAPLPKATKK